MNQNVINVIHLDFKNNIILVNKILQCVYVKYDMNQISSKTVITIPKTSISIMEYPSVKTLSPLLNH